MRRALLAGLLLALLAAAPADAARRADPFCFGAAAADPLRPCSNPRLATSVTPKPSEAVLQPNSPCDLEPPRGELLICRFGVRPERARATIALAGDSHAAHFRAALDVVVRRRGWHGVSMTRAGCPLSTARPVIDRELRKGCETWKRQVVAWLAANPQVTTLFVSQHSGGSIFASSAETAADERRRGYADMWRSLPASVHEVVVLRDIPRTRMRTFPCVERAIARGINARGCSVRRDFALREDPAETAARSLTERPTRVIDFTRVFCRRSSCPPVIGGVLVYKDTNHMTAVWGRTLGPLLDRALRTAP